VSKEGLSVVSDRRLIFIASILFALQCTLTGIETLSSTAAAGSIQGPRKTRLRIVQVAVSDTECELKDVLFDDRRGKRPATGRTQAA
jgi:hypothetical protein